jgi:transposase
MLQERRVMAEERKVEGRWIGKFTRGKSGTASIQGIELKYESLKGLFNERQRRLWAASEALSYGWGGIAVVAQATGLDPNTIARGIKELENPESLKGERQRRSGAGRKSLLQTKPGLAEALHRLVDPVTRGDPMSALCWTSKSTSKLAAELQQQGYQISPRSVAARLKEWGYSLQANSKTLEGTQHPDRDAQFRHLGKTAEEFLSQGEPVISVDTKKKELIGEFKNGGQEWQPQGCPEKVGVHDFPDPEKGKGVPYGVWDWANNTGWVNVGINHDTAEFAVESIRRWWRQMGQNTYPEATRLLITADSGGSNSSRARLWKVQLQKLADETGMAVSVCHLPPGTSKWNKIEHRMFCHITENWRGRPLTSYEVMVQLIAHTKNKKGLQIKAALDTNLYPKGLRISDQEMAQLKLCPNSFHGEWNYTLLPQ